MSLSEMTDLAWQNLVDGIQNAKLKSLSFSGMEWLTTDHLLLLFTSLMHVCSTLLLIHPTVTLFPNIDASFTPHNSYISHWPPND